MAHATREAMVAAAVLTPRLLAAIGICAGERVGSQTMRWMGSGSGGGGGLRAREGGSGGGVTAKADELVRPSSKVRSRDCAAASFGAKPACTSSSKSSVMRAWI